MKVLLAEDDAVSRYILQGMLRAFGYEVTACENGRQAWTAFCEGDYRLVISDWAMPEMDGIELCRKIRTSNRETYCYFILQTSNKAAIDSLADLHWGADSYLLKPFDVEDLKVRLRAAEKVLKLESCVQSLLHIISLCPCCHTTVCEETKRSDLNFLATSRVDAIERLVRPKRDTGALRSQ